MVVSAIKQKERKLAEERSARGDWGEIDLPDHSPASAANPRDKYDGVSVHVIQRLEDTVALYNMQFDALMTTLKEQVGKMMYSVVAYYICRVNASVTDRCYND